jgi:hypothetical protein
MESDVMTSNTRVRLAKIEAELDDARRVGDVVKMSLLIDQEQSLLQSVYGRLA